MQFNFQLQANHHFASTKLYYLVTTCPQSLPDRKMAANQDTWQQVWCTNHSATTSGHILFYTTQFLYSYLSLEGDWLDCRICRKCHQTLLWKWHFLHQKSMGHN